MREMKDSGVQWIGEIPNGWTVTRFKNVHGKTNVGEAIDKEFWSDDEIDTTFYTASVVPIHTSYQDFPDWKYTRDEDILFARNGTPYVYYPVSGAAYTDHIIRTDIIGRYDKRFIRYCLQRSIEYEVVNTVSIPTWSVSIWDKQVLSIPSKEIQAAIADFLDLSCVKIEALIANEEAQIEKLKAYKQSLITEVVTKGLDPSAPMKDSGVEWIGKMPSGWKTIRVKNLLQERKERSVDGLEEPLSMSQKLGLVPTKELDMIPNMASSFVGAKLAYVDDLVFNKLKAHLGVFSVSRFDGLVSPDYAVYYSTGRINLKYLEYLFKTPQCILEFRKRSTGIAAGLTRLYTDGLFAIECPYPSKEEQDQIVSFLNEKIERINQLMLVKQQKIDKLNTYKKSLIYEYVTGKKEVV